MLAVTTYPTWLSWLKNGRYITGYTYPLNSRKISVRPLPLESLNISSGEGPKIVGL